MIRFEEFEALGVALAAFTGKADGNCSLRDSERLAEGRAARAGLAFSCGVEPTALVCAQQVHGTAVVRAGAGERGRGAVSWEDALGPADAIVSGEQGLPLGVLVADCVPIYLYDPVRKAGGLAHAGWKGTLDDVAGAAIRALRDGWGCAPEDLHAFIGPSAGPCCYEVSEELAQQFEERGLSRRGRYVDLWESNVRRLVGGGIMRERVGCCQLCTICDERFYSHRREGCGGRNLALLVM